ncbi:MAG TPA: sigma-70 family RNA polymerase sigma factor [Kofleriaceae bacterium]
MLAIRAVDAADSRDWVTTAQAAWPDIVLDQNTFIAEVCSRIAANANQHPASTLHVADLWLAIACAHGNRVALAAFDVQYVAPLARILAPTGLSVDQIEDVKQELRRKLLVADGGVPRIAEYSGRAELRLWVRTIATRAAIDAIRRRREDPADDDDIGALPAIVDDPELAHLKDRYRSELADAIREAIARLQPRERLLLKYHFVDGFSIDRLGAIYGIHRATAARWLTAAREALADRAHRLLIARTGVTASELHSIVRLVQSQLEVSVRRLLA